VSAVPREPRRPPYWLLPVFAALMFSPPAWAAAGLIGCAITVSLLRRRAHGCADPAARGTPMRDLSASATGIVLGVDRAERAVVLDDHELSAHGLILGASGAGKSTTLLRILTDRIRRGAPVIAIDMKGSPAFARELELAAAEAGRQFRVWTPDGPDHWNPLQYGNATELKDKLIATERFTEPHYQRAAERYTQTVLQVLELTNPGCPPTLAQVVRLMEPQRLPAALRGLPRAFVERVQDYRASLSPDQLSAIRGLGTRLAILTESHTGKFLAPAGGAPSGLSTGAGAATGSREPRIGQLVDLRGALDGDEVVLFSLNSSSYGKLAAQIGTLLIQDLVTAAGHRLAEHGAPQAIVGIDEFSALGADHVISLLARGRESAVPVLLATQELADLDRVAPGLRDQVLGIVGVKIIHRQDVPTSAQTVAQMIGTERVWERTYQVGNRLFAGYDTGRGTRRQAEQFIVHPNEIKNLTTGEAILIVKTPSRRVAIVRVSGPPSADAEVHSPSGAPFDRLPTRPPRRAGATAERPAATSGRAAAAGQARGAAGPRSPGERRTPRDASGPMLGL
jgi:hypothetical protein